MDQLKNLIHYVFFLVSIISVAGCSVTADNTIKTSKTIHIIALNDFHGYIEPSPYTYQDPNDPSQSITVQAGGIVAISGLMKELRAKYPDLLFVAAGDLIGASPPISAMYADEPSLMALDKMGLDVSSLGNHELDAGKTELYRQIEGGCQSPRPDKACQYKKSYPGIEFDYVAANLIDTEKQTTAVAPYVIRHVKGVKVAIVGAVVENLSPLISYTSYLGLDTQDEADAINSAIPEIKSQNADIIISVIHEGGYGHAGANNCSNLTGPIVDIAKRLDPAVNVLISGHTHSAYICEVGDLLVTQGHHYGHLLTHLKISLDKFGTVEKIEAENILVDPNKFIGEPEILELKEDLLARSAQLINRPIAKIGSKDINRITTDAGECALGNLVADAQLSATKEFGVEIAFQNYDGIRADLSVSENNQRVTFSQIAAVHPFEGSLEIIDLTGAQIMAILEQQWPDEGGFYPLQISKGFTYSWDASKPKGNKVIKDTVMLNGVLLGADKLYRVAASGFLMGGGDGFSGFKVGTNRVDTGIKELNALENYLIKNEQLGHPAGSSLPEGRVKLLND